MEKKKWLSKSVWSTIQIRSIFAIGIRPKKKNCYVALTRPKFENWVGRSGFFFFFFFFFYVPWESRVFQYFFFKLLNGENSGGMQSKRISCKCFFKPLNTNFSKFFAQIWHKKNIKKTTLFFRILRSVGRGQHNIFFFLALWKGFSHGKKIMFLFLFVSDRAKLIFIFGGYTFHIPLPTNLTLRSIGDFRGSIDVNFPVLFYAFWRWNHPEPPCIPHPPVCNLFGRWLFLKTW